MRVKASDVKESHQYCCKAKSKPSLVFAFFIAATPAAFQTFLQAKPQENANDEGNNGDEKENINQIELKPIELQGSF